jgi:hypothetical protein
MPSARPLPTYPYEFNPFYNQNLELIAQEKVLYADWEAKHQEAYKILQNELTHLHEKAAKGIVIHTVIWQSMDRRLSDLNLAAERNKLGRARLDYTLSLAAAKLYGFFSDIEEDYLNAQLTLEQFKGYLIKYKHVIDSNLECYKRQAAAEKIWSKIQKHLPPEQGN